MNATRAAVYFVLISTSALASSASKEGSEGFGDEKVPRFSGVGPEVIALSERDDRIYWREVNSDLVIAYAGGVSVVNSALEQFASAKPIGDPRPVPRRDVILRPGPGRETTFEGGIVKCDMTFHAPGSLGRTLIGKAKTAQGEPIFEATPTLTIFIGDAVPLDKLKVPAGLRVLELDDLRDRYVAGLEIGLFSGDAAELDGRTRHEKVQDTTVRAQAAFALGSLKPLAKEVQGPLCKALADPEQYVRLCAIPALGELGLESAINDLQAAKKAAKDDRERQAIDEAIAKIKAARPPAAGLDATLLAIHKFKAARK